MREQVLHEDGLERARRGVLAHHEHLRVLGQHRSTQRKVPQGRADEEALTADIVALASLPSRDELLAKLLGTMQAPVAKLVRTMNEVPSKFVRTLAAVRDAKQAA